MPIRRSGNCATAMSEAAPAPVEPSGTAGRSRWRNRPARCSTSSAGCCSFSSSSAIPTWRHRPGAGATSGSLPAPVWSTSTCGRRCSAVPRFLGMCLLPILAKWLLIGRWKPRRIRIWSLGVRPLLGRQDAGPVEPAGPVRRFAALHALPAGAGREDRARRRDPLHAPCPCAPTCSRSAIGTVVRKDSFFSCYRAHAGLIETGAVTLGKDVFVGEMTVLDIGTSLGDGAQLGHTSSLHAGQAVPARRALARVAGAADRDGLPDGRHGTLRHPAEGRLLPVQLLTLLVVYLPLGSAACTSCSRRSRSSPRSWTPRLMASRAGRSTPRPWRSPSCSSSVPMLVGLLVVVTVPRLLNLAVEAGQGLPLVRLPLLGSPDDRADDQCQVLQDALR